MGEEEEEDAQCSLCHQYCHFSAVECDCSSDGRVSCAAHAGALCACPPGRWRLAFRYSLAELDAHLSGVFGAAASVGALTSGMLARMLSAFGMNLDSMTVWLPKHRLPAILNILDFRSSSANAAESEDGTWKCTVLQAPRR